MAKSGQRKCLNCGEFFDPDCRNRFVHITNLPVNDRNIVGTSQVEKPALENKRTRASTP